MSRPRMTPELAAEIAQQNFRKAVKHQLVEFDMIQRDLGELLGLKGPQTSIQLANPDKIPVGRLREIIRILRLDPMVILALLGYTDKELKQLRDRLAA